MFKVHLSHHRVLLLEQDFAQQYKRGIYIRFKKHRPIQRLLGAVKVTGADVSVAQMFIYGAIERIEVAFFFEISDGVGRLSVRKFDLAEQKMRLRKRGIERERFARGLLCDRKIVAMHEHASR